MTTKMREQVTFTVAEAAEYLNVSEREVHRCLRTQEPLDFIPHATVGEKRTKKLVRRADLDAWLDRHMNT